MHKNVGTTDAMIRITGGLLGLAYGVGKMSRRPYNTPWLLLAFSAMKVAEGVTRVCPMYSAMGVNTVKANGMQNIMDKAKQKGIQAVMNQVTRSMSMTGSTDKAQSLDKKNQSVTTQSSTSITSSATTASGN
ncbi:YgaP family membrane protein, partial [Paenibacillus chitinolyticus]